MLLTASLPFCFAQDGASASQQAAQARRQLELIDYRHYRDLDDYLSRCDQVRALIPRLEAFYKWSDVELERLRTKDSDNPQLLRLADFIVSLNSQDKAGLRVLRQEMDLAAEMSKLPRGKRQAFFDQKIRPLQQKEDGMAEREVDTVREAKSRGMALPPWLDKEIGASK